MGKGAWEEEAAAVQVATVVMVVGEVGTVAEAGAPEGAEGIRACA